MLSAPPHPRGSTLGAGAVAQPGAGSPAPAGIDPCAWPPQTPGRGLPRTRGDRPNTSGADQLVRAAPPHPRGSTLLAERPDAQPAGSPAPAGIDPIPKAKPVKHCGLPRTRGDRPATVYSAGSGTEAPPHPRGSTLDDALSEALILGSPAPAGINSSRYVRHLVRGRLPHPKYQGTTTTNPHPRNPFPTYG